MDPHTWIVVGLGNPGPQYERTRHNIGFWTIAACCRRWGATLKVNARFQAAVAEARAPLGHGSAPVLLIEPMTFMNASGVSVRKLLTYYKLSRERLIVISDDVALPLGRLRIRAEGSAGGITASSRLSRSWAATRGSPVCAWASARR